MPPSFPLKSMAFISSLFCSISSILFFLMPKSIFAVKCMNCRTLEEQLVCDDPCESDLCALWSFREMSTDHVLQGCLTGPDLRESMGEGLRMGCRRNRVDAMLCLCNSDDFCNLDAASAEKAHPSAQPMLPTEIQCHSRTSASFIRRQMVKPPRHQCLSDFCFFTQTNSTAISADDPLGHPPIVESTTSRNCGPQLEFNFDILLGPVWPGNGLHSEACYRLETGRDRLIGCSCSNNGCNRHMPYPIDMFQRHPHVKCHLGPQYAKWPTNSTTAIGGRQIGHGSPFCRGHFCFVQKETFHGYGDHWTSGCLSANESAANARLKIGYRNILGVEQWLCAADFCNGPILRRESSAGIEDDDQREGGAQRRRDDGGRTVDGPIGVGRGKTAGGKAEGGRVQAQNQAMAKKRKQQMEGEFSSRGGQSSAAQQKRGWWMGIFGGGHWHWQLLFFTILFLASLANALFL